MRIAVARPANLLRRMAAYLADTMILLAIWLVAQAILGFSPEQNTTAVTLINVTFSTLYFTYFHARDGATPGKKLMEIRVVSINGNALGLLQAFLRYSPYTVMEAMQLFIIIDPTAKQLAPEAQLVLLVYLLWYGVSAVLILTRPDRRTLHDLLAFTQVLHLPQQERNRDA